MGACKSTKSLLNEMNCNFFSIQKKQRLELFFKMEKSFAQAREAQLEETITTNQPRDETLVAVATLTSMMKTSAQLEFDRIDENVVQKQRFD